MMKKVLTLVKKQMLEHLIKDTKHYQTDFINDLEILEDASGFACNKCLWITRDNGTFLLGVIPNDRQFLQGQQCDKSLKEFLQSTVAYWDAILSVYNTKDFHYYFISPDTLTSVAARDAHLYMAQLGCKIDQINTRLND